MSEQDDKYNLVFRGELIKGAELGATKLNIAKLFKISSEKVDGLFSGKAITLKRGLSLDAATKYRVAIKKAGARVDLEMQQQSPAPAPSTPAPSTPAPSAPAAPSQSPSATVAKQVVDASTVQPEARDPVKGNFDLSPAGADLLKESEKHHQPEVTLDLSAYSVRDLQGNLVDSDERQVVEPVAVSVEGIDIAEVGVDLLKPEDKAEIPNVQVDLSGLSLAEPGSRIGPKASDPPPAPDVSQIKLAEDDQ